MISKERLALHAVEFRVAPEPAETPARPRRRLGDRVRAEFANATMFLWIVVFSAILALEPAPADANAATPLWADVLFTGYFAAFAATFIGLAKRRRFGFAASLVAALFGVGIGVGCQITEHHAGLYPLVEIGGFGLLGVVGASGLLRRLRP